MQKRALVAGIVAAISGACVTDLPTIQYTGGADSVIVTSDRDAIEDSCTKIGPIIVEDGMTGRGRWHYEGTESRLEKRIRNLAVRLGADTIWIDESKSTISYTTDGAKGFVVGSSGIAYRCNED